MPERYDVAVLGAGPAGSVTAMLLARSGLSVALLDKSHSGKFNIGETLPPQASSLLADLKLSEAFHAQGHQPSPGIVSAWGSAEPKATDFIFSPYGNGWHIDRPKFNAMLVAAATQAGVALYRETGVQYCTADEGGWRLRTSAGRQDVSGILKCRFLVDSSGRCPSGSFGFPPRVVFDRLIAVAALCHPSPRACASDYTLVEAVDEGWFYSALLPGGEYVLAYMTDGDLYAAGREQSNAFLQSQLAKAPHTGGRIEWIPAHVALFSAVTSVRNTVATDNWLAVGDAARSYDPLSGLGLCSAMQMAMQAAPVVVQLLQGEGSKAREYDRANSDSFLQYRETHQAIYGLERRWPHSEFWARRQQKRRTDPGFMELAEGVGPPTL